MVAKKEMKLLQRFNEQKIHWEPDRSARLKVAAEQAGARLRRLSRPDIPCHRPLAYTGDRGEKREERADAVGRKKFILIQHIV